jgi:rare lipoprotein A
MAELDPSPGVTPSPRVVADGQAIPRGGGREQVGQPYQVAGTWYRPQEDPNYDRTGVASWYGEAFHGRLTANGEVFDAASLSAAHPTLPLPSYVRVTNLDNGRSLIVRVNDRGPFLHARLIDLSERAAELLDFKRSGSAQVRVQYVDGADLDGDDERFLIASYRGPGGYPEVDDAVTLASAEARTQQPRPVAAGAPVQLAAAILNPAAAGGGVVASPAVAFVAGEGETDGALEAMQPVTASYPADERIFMAFQLIGDTSK